MTPTIKLEHADSRGEIYSIELPDGQELMLLHSNPGSFRGGHSHTCGEIVVLLSGKMNYYKKRYDTAPDSQRRLIQGESSLNRAGEIHMGEFESDSWVIEMKFAKKNEWQQTDYEPWRKLVREGLEAKRE